MGVTTVTVFCGSSPGSGPGHMRIAAELGRALAEAGLRLVYGGARIGLMGALADGALAAGGAVTGVVPSRMLPYEIAHTSLTDLEVVADMHQRKARMAEAGDAFVALPGGLGTAEELLEVLSWAQLRIHRKPCVLLDPAGFYGPLLTFLEHARDEGFLHPGDLERILVCGSAEEVVARLAGTAPASSDGAAVRVPTGRTAFLFSAAGSQQPGVGRDLYGTSAAFAGALDEVCARLDPYLGMPLRDVMFAPAGTPTAALLDRAAFGCPAAFALQVAQYRLLESQGLEPDVLFGYSAGHLAAAYAAGVFSLADACHAVGTLSRLMKKLPGGGCMAALEVSPEELRPGGDGGDRDGRRAPLGGGVRRAGGGDGGLRGVGGTRSPHPCAARRHGAPSPYFDPLLDGYRRVLRTMSLREPRIPLVRDTTGERVGAEATDPEHWVRALRDPVRFTDAVACLRREGVTAFLELGPGEVLAGMLDDCLPLGEDRPIVLSVTRNWRAAHGGADVA